MSFFSKVFGTKGTTGKTAAEPRRVDFSDALSMHLAGELDPALDAYLRLAKEVHDDTVGVAIFLASAIKAGKGDVAQAAESLRSLSLDLSSRGDAISAVILSGVVAVAPGRTVPAVAEVIVSFAEVLKKECFIQEAAVCLEIAAGLVPDNANVLHKFGDTLHDLRMYEYAESVLLDALKRAPNHWSALYTYAVLLQDLQRDEEALAYYEKAVKFNPSHARCRNNYGAALMRTNRLEEALVHCTAAAELDPDSPLVKINLGNIHMLMQQYETARTCFTEAISVDQTLAPAHFGLGRVEELLGSEPARIREPYLKALQIDPSLAKIYPAINSFVG